jgi:hypothetical protein
VAEVEADWLVVVVWLEVPPTLSPMPPGVVDFWGTVEMLMQATRLVVDPFSTALQVGVAIQMPISCAQQTQLPLHLCMGALVAVAERGTLGVAEVDTVVARGVHQAVARAGAAEDRMISMERRMLQLSIPHGIR